MNQAQSQTSNNIIVTANTRVTTQNTATYTMSAAATGSGSLTATSPTYRPSIDTYTWYAAEVPKFETSTRELYVNLASAFGGAQVLVDQGARYIFYIDKAATP